MACCASRDNIFVVGRIFQLLAPSLRSTGWRSLDPLRSDAVSGGASRQRRRALRRKRHRRVCAGVVQAASTREARCRMASRQQSHQPGEGFRHGVHAAPRGHLHAAWFRHQGHLRRGVQGSIQPRKVHDASWSARSSGSESAPSTRACAQFELSVGRQWGRLAADVAAYHTTYSNLVTLAPHRARFGPRDRADSERSDRPTRRPDPAAPDLRRIFRGFGSHCQRPSGHRTEPLGRCDQEALRRSTVRSKVRKRGRASRAGRSGQRVVQLWQH